MPRISLDCKSPVVFSTLGRKNEKGNLLHRLPSPLLKEKRRNQFHRDIEGRDILANDKADVMVCEDSRAM